MSTFYDQASLVLIPSGYKEDVVYSQKPTDGSGDLTFTRASDGTRVNSAGYVENVPWNLLLQSNTFNTTWVLSNATVTSGQSGYDGTNNAWEFDASGIAQVSQSVSTSGIQTFSVYAKAGSENGLFLRANGGNNPRCFFNLDSGTIGNEAGGLIDSEMLNVGNGWYRCTIIYSDTTNEARIYVANNSGGFPTSGSIYIQDAQLNTGSTAKPYFPTTDRQNVPRLTYEGGCPSLLLEPQATALNTNSENAAGWTAVGSTITSDSTISPDGTQNADTITYSSSGSRIQQEFTISDTKATLSVFVKSNTGDGAYLIIRNNTTATNLVTVAFTGETFTAGAGGQTISYANGWYRISVTATSGISSGNTLRAYIYSDSGQGVVSGSSVYVWGMNCTNTSYLQSYIPTTSAAVTRVADVCNKTGISSLIGGTSGTVFFDITTNPVLSSASYKQFCYYFDSASAQSYLYLNSVNQISTNVNWGSLLYSTPLQPNTRYKVALVYAPNDFALYINGVSVATASSGTPKNNERISIGQLAGTEMCEFVFNQYTHFPSRLTNDQLEVLTGDSYQSYIAMADALNYYYD